LEEIGPVQPGAVHSHEHLVVNGIRSRAFDDIYPAVADGGSFQGPEVTARLPSIS
jgi:hypothetical protein